MPGSTQPLTEINIGNIPGGKGHPVLKADNLTAICDMSRKCGGLDVLQSYGSLRPVPFFTFIMHYNEIE
jgi:hypothetical protein